MYTSFFKRQRQYDTFKAKELSIKRYCHNKRRARYACIPRSLSVSDNDTFKAKELSIKRYCHNKWRARYACIPRSLSVSDNKTRLSERNYQSRDTATTNGEQMASQICMYTSFFKHQRQYDTFKRDKLSNERYCHNKWQARYACILRSLSVGDNMTRLSETKFIIKRDILPQQTASQICMYTSFFKRQRQYDTFKAKELSIERYCHKKRRARYACIPRS